MSQFFKAELKDKFLQYTSERDDYFEMQLLYDEFLRPNYSLEFAEKLVREIIDYNPALLNIMSGSKINTLMISAGDSIEDFIEEGGFTAIYIAEEEKWDVFINQLPSPKKATQKEKLDVDKTAKIVYKRERSLLFFLIAAVSFSFLFTLFSIIRDVFFDSNKIELSRLEERITKIEQNNNQHKKIEVKEHLADSLVQ